MCFIDCCRQSVTEFQATKDTKYASAETSAREWAEVTAKANMHKGKWSEYWQEAKAAGDLGDQQVHWPCQASMSPNVMTQSLNAA